MRGILAKRRRLLIAVSAWVFLLSIAMAPVSMGFASINPFNTKRALDAVPAFIWVAMGLSAMTLLISSIARRRDE